MSEINFEIIKEVQLLSETSTGNRKELNLVKWGDREPKLEIRTWQKDHGKAYKGITLTDIEAKLLRDALNRMEI